MCPWSSVRSGGSARGWHWHTGVPTAAAVPGEQDTGLLLPVGTAAVLAVRSAQMGTRGRGGVPVPLCPGFLGCKVPLARPGAEPVPADTLQPGRAASQAH